MSRYRGRRQEPKRMRHKGPMSYVPDDKVDGVMQLYEEVTARRRIGEDRPQGKVPLDEEKELGKIRQSMGERLEPVFVAMEESSSRPLDRNIILDAFCRTTNRAQRATRVFGDLMAGQLTRPEIDKLKTVAVALFKTDVMEKKTGLYFDTLMGVMESIIREKGDNLEHMRDEANNTAVQVLYAKRPRQVYQTLQELREKHR